MNDTSSGVDVSRDEVRDYYSKAAAATQDNLCCPVKYEPTDLSHIPKRVLEISYGCGSPVNRADITCCETMVDLGAGGGIDCFIASKLVGDGGKVFGIDMTEEMLNVARSHAKEVGDNLGYHNIEFKHGFLESIPLEDETADVVTSNCVINLSTHKKKVFQEINRVLKPGGRFVIADIISDLEVPDAMRQNKDLWGECVSGALALDQFVDYARQADFHGFSVQKDYLWKVVEGIKFYSYIITGYKRVAAEESCCAGTRQAIYAGPFPSVTCENIQFPVGVAVEVDEGVADVLAAHPYNTFFNIIDPENESVEDGSDDDSCCG